MGPALGPVALRAAGLVHRLEQLGNEVTDCGDLVPSGGYLDQFFAVVTANNENKLIGHDGDLCWMALM